MATDFEKKNGNIEINVTQMKESPSSEATIQSAIASGTQPTMSENITRSFGAQLAKSKVIIPLNKDSYTKKSFSNIVRTREMKKTMGNWEFANGNQYVLPIYSNPMLFGWRIDLLKEIGINHVPKTYSDVIKVSRALKSRKGKNVVWALPTGTDPTAWQRWFDFSRYMMLQVMVMNLFLEINLKETLKRVKKFFLLFINFTDLGIY
ncbi:hypothetical protein Q757_03450 [Oenococcus alcoholitolerans]|uniref:Uncharacterized protein n=1 Tax=Oenococcus alcoholitolerans TaxID=931074 RepID=A0ABR4XRL0_9LACO|nr:hypothetical protein Q757_03450 [Oenococcus alcoholitolerans]